MTISQPYGYPVQIGDPTIPPIRVGPDTAEFDTITRAAISAEMRRQRERIQELLTRCSELVEENRRLKAQRPDRRADVTAFHNLLGHGDDVAEKPRVPSDEQIALRLRLIGEEFCELLEATGCGAGLVSTIEAEISEAIRWRSNPIDLPELADATIDIEYLTEGLRVCCGIDGAPLWDAVQKANMAKVGGGRRADGKIIKPEGWRAPPIQELLMAQGWDGK